MEFKHRDGRTASASTPTESVTLRAMGFVAQRQGAVDDSPSEEWSHARLDEYAVAHNVDLTGAKTKAEKAAAIAAPPAIDDNA